jgi:asparagine synthetase B (glutamine-hydrolysing)
MVIPQQLRQDLDVIVKQLTEGAKVCSMLSGGIDSFTVTYLASKYVSKIEAVTVHNGTDGQDVIWAKKCADALKIQHHVILYSAVDAYNDTKEFLRKFPLTRTIVRLQCGLVTAQCAKFAKGLDFDTLLCGDGADAVFGSTGDMRRKSKKPDFNAIRRATCEKGISQGVGHDFVAVSSYYGLKPALPYRDKTFIDTYSQIEDKIVNKPHEKQILRDAFRDELPSELIDRERLTLQVGVGIKEQHKELLKKHSVKGYKSPKYLIKEIVDEL